MKWNCSLLLEELTRQYFFYLSGESPFAWPVGPFILLMCLRHVNKIKGLTLLPRFYAIRLLISPFVAFVQMPERSNIPMMNVFPFYITAAAAAPPQQIQKWPVLPLVCP